MSEADNGLVTGYGYDANGQQRSQTVQNGGIPVTTMLDAEGRTTSIAESGNAASYGYNLADLPVTATLPGGTGVQASLGYDKASRPTHVGLTGPTRKIANVLSSSYDYGYDAVGRTKATTATVNVLNGGKAVVTSYTHDGQDELTGASGGTAGSWTYDGNGNLKTAATGGVTTTYTYATGGPSGINELQQVSSTAGITTYGYDSGGDTASITRTGGISTGAGYEGGRSSWLTAG